MSLSGAATRSIGRWRSDASPVSSLSNGCPASSPISSRIPVPELPRSRTLAGARSPRAPDAFDSHEAFRLALDGDAHGLERRLGGETILAREETMNDRRPFRDRTEHQRAMRDGLVAGDGDSAADVRRRHGTKAVRML